MPENPSGNAIFFDKFSFRYKSQSEPALRDICLSIRRGEKILIAGPSGSGKTTLVHCINGLIPHAFPGQASGRFSLNGKDAFPLGISNISKIAGTVLQDTDGQFVGLSAGEDIAFAAENDCIPPEEMKKRVLEAAKLTRIEQHLDKSPQTLSGGQKQRVSMAGILMDDVDILLFDEPLANLDPETGKHAIELIDTLHRETGKTVVLVEHRLEDALHRNIDRVALIDRGTIIACLPPAEMLASGLLAKTGIREPLYVSALRYAGIPVCAEQRPDNLDLLRFDAEKLREWDAALPDECRKPREATSLSVQNLCFRYRQDDAPALEGISFSVAKGERVGVAGQNGAGKSTLAQLIAGFYRPESGSIFLGEKDITGDSIKERAENIGYVMQNPNQMISFPIVFDETAFALRMRGVAEAEVTERVNETLKICGLYPFRNWPVSALSFGQKKRLTIASILSVGPGILILDEPTAGQDFRHYSEIMEFLRGLNRQAGLTLMMITHDMHLMLEYTERALVFSGGKLIADGAPADILTDDAVVEAAHLKQTSLYELALRAGIENPQGFVRHFIEFENSRRGERAYGRIN
ncbi:MAG: ABC transporter ATP-binding protein [Spirochaetaceae bacterium]|jgi:energy-coupling factor transport system ATP-binding protein|nr:ABC transporter ATP-binding protein [Spirochaetaceae bacterium]